jgi:hypothetical protein
MRDHIEGEFIVDNRVDPFDNDGDDASESPSFARFVFPKGNG